MTHTLPAPGTQPAPGADPSCTSPSLTFCQNHAIATLSLLYMEAHRVSKQEASDEQVPPLCAGKRSRHARQFQEHITWDTREQPCIKGAYAQYLMSFIALENCPSPTGQL